MSDKVMKAAQVAPPREGKVYRFNATTSNQVFIVPDAWKQQWIEIEAAGEVDYAFGNRAGMSVTVNGASSTTGTPVALTVSTATGEKLREGVPKQMYLGQTDTHLAIRAGATVAVTVSIRS